MSGRGVSRADAKMIAETAADLAGKALNWKDRALAAEEALRKFASEIYGRPDGDWQPIETAPRDGTEVLVWRDHIGVMLARFIAPDDFLTDRELIELHPDDAATPDWFAADFVQSCRLESDCAPTHWMPLPEAPTTPSQSTRS